MWRNARRFSLGQELSVRIAVGSAYQEDTIYLSMAALVSLMHCHCVLLVPVFH
jgi:hypothetical protein